MRVTKPLRKFGAKFKTNFGKLPITIEGTDLPKPIKYNETKGSAQCKSAVMFAALNTLGETTIKAKKSRDHSELLFKHLKLPIKIIRPFNFYGNGMRYNDKRIIPQFFYQAINIQDKIMLL